MMELLNIKELRRGANGSNREGRQRRQLDESKANPVPRTCPTR